MTDPLSKLPLFATDRELAVAIVGKERATMWVKTVLPQLERKGFPRVDPLHDGRPVPLVRKWYELHMGLHRNYVPATLEDGKDNPEAWRSKREQQADRKPRLNLDTRCHSVLRYMVDHPSARTHRDIRGVGERTLEKLAQSGAIETVGMDDHDDRMWTVTDLGREEMKRIDDWYHGKRAT